MADPATWALIISATAGAVGSYSAISQGQYARRQGEANASAAAAAGLDAYQRGQNEAAAVREQGARLSADQRVAYATAGTDFQSGTPLDVIVASAGITELDALTAKNNAAREAWGYQMQAANYRAQGRAEARKGTMSAIGTLLTTGTQAYGIGSGAGMW